MLLPLLMFPLGRCCNKDNNRQSEHRDERSERARRASLYADRYRISWSTMQICTYIHRQVAPFIYSRDCMWHRQRQRIIYPTYKYIYIYTVYRYNDTKAMVEERCSIPSLFTGSEGTINTPATRHHLLHTKSTFDLRCHFLYTRCPL